MRRPPGDELKRYAAPAAFLAAVTVAVVLIHNGLQSGGSSATIPTATPVTSSTTTAKTGTTRTQTTNAQYYTVRSGDTLGVIAEKYGTSVDILQALNPNVDPAALQPGQKIRVK